jgi:hypothetical protein
MLLVILPVTNVSISVRKMLSTFSVHLANFEVTFISWLVWPDHDTFAVHVIIFEFSLVELAGIREVIFAVAVELAVNEVSLVVASFKFEAAVAWLLSVDEHAGVFDFVIAPGFTPVAVLLVVHPLALIHGSVGVNESSVAIGFPIQPLSLVDVFICMGHTPLAVKNLIFGHSLISGSIWKNNES